MPVDSKPHSSWADVYDLVYEHSFRNFYHELTNVTLSVIEDRVNSNSRIVDFGAGTGRLSIPLSKKGFDVVAVDPCEEMLAQLKQKQQNGKLQTICLKMENFTTDDKFDVALCVFTVLLYLLDEKSLLKALSAAYLQSWNQTELSKIIFGIQPTVIWDENNKRGKEAKRQADIYVFCVLAHKDKSTVNPLDLSQWDFYVLDTDVLNDKVPKQKTITLSSLLRLNPSQIKYDELANEIYKE